MAKCLSCGASVGCGCNLKNGMCAFCANKKKEEIKVVQPTTTDRIELERLV
jgi:hypothetical protein